MNLSNKVLKLLGMKIASQMLETDIPPEVRLWRAVVTLAVEDVLNISQSRNEAVIKANAHDWFVNNSDDFQKVCYHAKLDPEFVRDQYFGALDTGKIFFTRKQHLYIRYTQAYEKLRKEKDPIHRKRLTKVIEKLRSDLLKS
jgi:hypothetical protein